MTEDEAKTKWCPFVRLTGTEREWHANRPQGAAAPSERSTYLCMGSACMAWRVVREEVSGTDADGFGYVRSAVTGGYCGLAGAPQ